MYNDQTHCPKYVSVIKKGLSEESANIWNLLYMPLLIPLENKHYKTKLRHQLFGTERGFIELVISTEGEGKTKDKQ